MVERNMSKFERWVNKFQSGEEFLFEHRCTFEELYKNLWIPVLLIYINLGCFTKGLAKT
jgi:hypothetical protein